MATDYVKKINNLPVAASAAAPSSALSTTLNGKVGTVTTTGTGSVVTDVTKSGATITVTKGDIALQKLTNPNFDNVLTPGVYNVQVTQACTGAPPGLGNLGSCILIVNAVEGDAITSQTVIMANGRTCSRGRGADGTWDTFWANRESRGIADATDAHAEGDSTQATGNNAHSEGYNTRATGASSHAEGNSAQATAGQAHAEGYNTLASAQSAHAEGTNGSASGRNAHKEGYNGSASGESSHTEGSLGVSAGTSSHTEGGVCYAYGKDSHAEGYDTKSGKFTIDSSTGTKSLDSANTSINSFNNCTQHAEGWSTWAGADASHAEGYQSYVYGDNNHLGGHAEGYQSYVSGAIAGHAEGEQSYVAGTVAGHAEGFQTYTGGGAGNHSEGYQTVSTGSQGSHTEGVGTYASGKAAHAEGYRDVTNAYGATAIAAHSEGYDTLAGGNYAHAEGEKTVANSEATHAEGIGTVASGTAGMHAAGKYNYTGSGYARVTGWGTGPETENRKDIERLDTDGNLWIAGGVSCNGMLITPLLVVPGRTHANGNPTYTEIWNAVHTGTPIFFQISEPLSGLPYWHRVPARPYYTTNQDVFFDITLQGYNDGLVYTFTYKMCYNSSSQDEPTWYFWYDQQGTGTPSWVQMTNASAGGVGTPIPSAVANTISGVLPASKGGTGETSLRDAMNSMVNALSTGSDQPKDNDYYVSQYVNGGTTTTTYHRRPMSKLKSYVLNGGTMTGQFTSTVNNGYGFVTAHGTSNACSGYVAKRTDTSTEVSLEVGTGGQNHGVYSNIKDSGNGDWMIYTDSTGKTRVNGQALGLTDYGDSAEKKFVNVQWTNSGQVTSGVTPNYLAGFYNSQGNAVATICDIPPAGLRAIFNEQYLCAALKDVSTSFTVTQSDISGAKRGQLYLYRNTSENIIACTWKRKSNTNASGDVYVGCTAVFMLVDVSNGYFTRVF